VSPLRANDFANLPRTLLICAEIDPLLNDVLEYARRLARERVTVDLQVYAGMFHGFRCMGGVLDEARSAIHRAGDRMKQIREAHQPDASTNPQQPPFPATGTSQDGLDIGR
jgi:acetyl esterase